MARADKLKENLASQQLRGQELAFIRDKLAADDAVVKLDASHISDFDKQIRVLGFSEKAKAMLPLDIFTNFVHKAALQLHDLCLKEGPRAELAQLAKFTELLQGLGKASFVNELHVSESEDVVKDSTQHN